jgi:glyoxylase-like metal-dependent hydrolase (beta-lactamase superfamily II)
MPNASPNPDSAPCPSAGAGPGPARIQAFFDPASHTISYLLADPATGDAAVIDPVLDFDGASGMADTSSAARILEYARQQGWRIRRVLETHAHADHLSAAPFFKEQTGASIGIGEHIRTVQALFRPVFALDDLKPDGGDFDALFADGQRFDLGTLAVEVLHVPGHTPADVAYRVGADVFVGDTLFMPDYGTARADFPGGDAQTMYRSIRRLLALPDATRLWLCHDYKAPGRDAYAWTCTVADQRHHNVHVHEGIDEASFVALRQARDATLTPPALLLPAIQVNLRAGHLPRADAQGRRFLKIPVRLRPGPAAAG